MARIALVISLVMIGGVFGASPSDSGDAKTDAYLLAMTYVARYLDEYVAESPTLIANHWESVVIGGGRDRAPRGVIRIDRSTGNVSYEGPLGSKPSVSAAVLRHWLRYGHD